MAWLDQTIAREFHRTAGDYSVVWYNRDAVLSSTNGRSLDPEVIRRFAAIVGTERRLTALYILTHADIRATSPKVWNGWKAQLLEELFGTTRQLLRGDAPDQILGRLAGIQFGNPDADRAP